MSLSPGTTTLAAIRTEAADRADLPTPTATSVVSLSTFNGWVYRSALELYDLLTSTYEDWNVIPQPYPTITTDGINSQFALPSDFYKLTGVNLLVSQLPSGRLTLKRFNLIDRNRYALPGSAVNGLWAFMRYAVIGNPPMLWLIPEPPMGGQVLEIVYTPRMKALADSGTVTLSGVVAGDKVTVSSSFMLYQVVATNTVKVGSTTFTAVSTPNSGTNFQVGANDTATAANLATQINAQLGPAITATSSSTTPTLTVTFTFTAQAGANSGTNFQVGASDAATASNLSTVMNAQSNLGLTATADGTTALVTVNLTSTGLVNGQTITWAASPDFALSPQGTWTNLLDAVQGWEEYVTLDVTIKAMTKQQLDASEFMAQKAAMKERILALASNRDEGQVWTVSDTANVGGVFGNEYREADGSSGW